MAVFIGKYTKSNVTVSVAREETTGGGTLDVTITDGDADTTFTLLNVDSPNVIRGLQLTASSLKPTGMFRSFYYFDGGHQVLITPEDDKGDKTEYGIPMELRSIPVGELTGPKVLPYPKNIIVVISDNDNPAEVIIDPRNIYGDISAVIDDRYKITIVLVKYGNWVKLKHEAHIAINVPAVKTETMHTVPIVDSYKLGVQNIKVNTRKFDVDALVQDSNPAEVMAELKETIEKESARREAIKQKIDKEKSEHKRKAYRTDQRNTKPRTNPGKAKVYNRPNNSQNQKPRQSGNYNKRNK